jgi:hypothetical protein
MDNDPVRIFLVLESEPTSWTWTPITCRWMARAVGGITGDTGADRRGERMTRMLSVYFGAVALLVAAVAIVRAFS